MGANVVGGERGDRVWWRRMGVLLSTADPERFQTAHLWLNTWIWNITYEFLWWDGERKADHGLPPTSWDREGFSEAAVVVPVSLGLCCGVSWGWLLLGPRSPVPSWAFPLVVRRRWVGWQRNAQDSLCNSGMGGCWQCVSLVLRLFILMPWRMFIRDSRACMLRWASAGRPVCWNSLTGSMERKPTPFSLWVCRARDPQTPLGLLPSHSQGQ